MELKRNQLNVFGENYTDLSKSKVTGADLQAVHIKNVSKL